jgi:hypothetical protein
MRLTICVLGAELLSVELSADEVADEPEGEPEALGGAAGGQFEMGFRATQPVLSPNAGTPPS